MKSYFLYLGILLLSMRSFADDCLCKIEPPIVFKNETYDLNSNKIVIESDSSEATAKDGIFKGLFKGSVALSQKDNRILANSVSVNTNIINAEGNLTFRNTSVTVIADKLEADTTKNTAILINSKYWVNGFQINGTAKELNLEKNKNILLTKAEFSTCPIDNRSWLLVADKIEIDSYNEWAEVWGAKVKIYGTTLGYVPYITLPISNKRKSGLLYPTFSSSTTDGIVFSQPIYWNIAPEYDLTIIPEIISKRGFLLKNELRYLLGEQQGKANFEFMNRDSLDNNNSRYMFHWEQKGKIYEHMRFFADYTSISDNNYFNDLNSEIGAETDSQIIRVGELSYFEKNWDLSLRVQDILVLNKEDKPYRIMPQLTYNYTKENIFRDLNFKLNTEATNFTNRDPSLNTANRLHIEPSLVWPVYTPSASLISEVKLMQTFYEQDNIESDNNLKGFVSRTLPEIRINGKINFERDINWFSSDARQTIEPQFQYLYIGYQDQKDIGIYDTGVLHEDYIGLFRDRRFAGLDRIADANQLTIGVSSAIYDENDQEVFKANLGEIVFLKPSRVGISENLSRSTNTTSLLAAELVAKLSQNWYVNSGVQVDSASGSIANSSVLFNYRPQNNKLLQLNYRYLANLVNINTNKVTNIEQAGLLTAWPLTNSVSFVGSWNYDLNGDHTLESSGGIQYEACCWAVRLSYRRSIKTDYEQRDAVATYENGVYFNFEIKGLGGVGPLGIDKMLNEGIFNYKSPLYLRN